MYSRGKMNLDSTEKCPSCLSFANSTNKKKLVVQTFGTSSPRRTAWFPPKFIGRLLGGGALASIRTPLIQS